MSLSASAKDPGNFVLDEFQSGDLSGKMPKSAAPHRAVSLLAAGESGPFAGAFRNAHPGCRESGQCGVSQDLRLYVLVEYDDKSDPATLTVRKIVRNPGNREASRLRRNPAIRTRRS